jgi:hypothetical protein
MGMEGQLNMYRISKYENISTAEFSLTIFLPQNSHSQYFMLQSKYFQGSCMTGMKYYRNGRGKEAGTQISERWA